MVCEPIKWFRRRRHGFCAADLWTSEPQQHAVSDKLSALLVIASKVRLDGHLITEADVSRARQRGADDQAIHDTVLMAAAFCLFGLYIEGWQRGESAPVLTTFS